MVILKFQMGKVCILSKRFPSSLIGFWLLSLYIILLNFIEIGAELFEISEVQNQTQTHTQTDRHIHADEIIPVQNQRFWGR